MAVYTQEVFFEKLKEKNKDWDKIQFLSPFVKAKQKIACRCRTCSAEWSPTPSSLLQGTGCPVCKCREGAMAQTKTHDQFIKEFNEIKEGNEHLEFINIIGQYLGEKKKISAICLYCNTEWDATPRNLLKGSGCPKCKGRFVSEAFIKSGKWVGNNNPRHINPMYGSDNPNWKDGASDLYKELRKESKEWFISTNKVFDWKCALTGSKFDNVHHLVAFKDLLSETLEIFELDRRKSIGDYSTEEQIQIREGIRLLHKKYGLGVSLCEPIHVLFHKQYGYGSCTKYNFLEFVNRCVSGEFDDYLVEHGLFLNINPKLYNVLLNNLY